MSVEEISNLVKQKQLLEAKLRKVNRDLSQSRIILEKIDEINTKIQELQASLDY